MTTSLPYRMITARISPGVELVRWLFERQGVAYREEAHTPILIPTANLPVVVTPPGAVWRGPREALVGLDATGGAGARLFGETEAERAANQGWAETLIALLLEPVPRCLYATVLPSRALALATATHHAPAWERVFVSGAYPLALGLMTRNLGLTPAAVAEAPARVEEAFARVEAELARQGSPFLGGDTAGLADIVFAALSGPVVYPRNYGARLPPLDELPAPLRAFILENQTRPAGDLAIRTYATARAYR